MSPLNRIFSFVAWTFIVVGACYPLVDMVLK
jgi:hypothetical protein